MTEIDDTIIDSTKPNAGRIYDYLIGGHHYFPVDKKAAEEILKMAPFVSTGAKYVRWFMQKAIKIAKERGFTQFIDFASGLPVEDHIHKNTPEGTKVIYSDLDPITVQYGRRLIGENPIVKYETCDAAKPETLLESVVVKSLFGNNHKTAIGFSGICWFLTDEQVKHAMRVLYDWADKDSILYITDMDNENISKEYQSMMDLYKQMNQPVYLRTQKELIELVNPWVLDEPGFLPVDKWYNRPTKVIEEAVKFIGGGTGAFGGLLKK